MSWEIHTFGGGEYLSIVFNAIAGIFKKDEYTVLLYISASAASIWAAILAIWNFDPKEHVRWLVSVMVLSNLMFYPKTDVLINDHLNHQKKYDAVKSVPYALGVFASITSSVGYEITKLMETSFTAPDYLPYHRHGMLFGSKLRSATHSMKIPSNDFASSINSFVKQCVFYDIRLGKYTLEELKEAEDIWEFLTKEHKQSPARSFIYNERGEDEIMTCQSGLNELNKRWNEQTDSAIEKYLPIASNQTQSQDTSKKAMLALLMASYQPFNSISQNATDLVRQNMMINAIDRSAGEFSNTGAFGSNIYMEVRSKMQTQAAFSASKAQADEWVPTLKIVFEVLFYGAFPLVALLFLMPIGLQIAKSYFLTFVWLQSWAPLYALLNMIMTLKFNEKAQALGDITIMTHSGIEAINYNTALIAGYISWSIPFIAFVIARGVGAVSGLATSMLAIPQMTANTAAAEASTGNISLGNSNIDNSSYNNVSGNKINDSAFFDNGRVQAINTSGGMTTLTADGRTVYDQTGSVSRVPNMSLSTNDTQSSSFSQNASRMESIAESESRQAAESRSSAVDVAASSLAAHSINEDSSLRFTDQTTTDTREALSRVEGMANELSAYQGVDTKDAFLMTLNGSIGLGGKGLGLNGGGSISGVGSHEGVKTSGVSENERVSNSNQLSKDVSTVMNAINDKSLQISDSHGNSLNESFSQSYNESLRLEEQSRAHYEEARNFSEQAQLVDSQSTQFTQDQIPGFIDYVKTQKDINGHTIGERALNIMATDPIATENFKNSYIASNGGTAHQDNFNSNRHYLQANNLNEGYQVAKGNIKDPTVDFSTNNVKQHFNDNTFAKGIDNSHLQKTVENKIASNESQITAHQHDKAGVVNEIHSKLQDGAFVTAAKSMLPSDSPKSNFNKPEDK